MVKNHMIKITEACMVNYDNKWAANETEEQRGKQGEGGHSRSPALRY